jgi:hypothetical protein
LVCGSVFVFGDGMQWYGVLTAFFFFAENKK